MDSERTTRKDEQNINVEVDEPRMVYGVEDIPSIPACLFFGFQQAFMSIGPMLIIPYLIPGLICAKGDYELTAKLVSISLFMSGLATILQTLFGIRLGIVQGGFPLFAIPIASMMATDKWKCPDNDVLINATATEGEAEEPWKSRMREIQGNLIVASVTQVVFGLTGVIGIFLKFIGPLTIASTLIGCGPTFIGLFVNMNKQHWGIAFFAMGLTMLFSAYMANIKPPFPAWTLQRRCHVVRFPIFQLFSVLLSLCIAWFLCYTLTVSDVFPNNSTDPHYLLRTDAKNDAIEKAPWFYWPYPFQFGTPTVSSSGYVSFLVVTLISILDSICDFQAAARLSGVLPPPPHAVNRGIAVEGFASILSGLVGAGHATTAYSHNIGAIGITKVASRAVFLTTGIILLIGGVVGKCGAVLTIIPDPVVGGVMTVLVGMVMASGVSAMKFVNLNSTRNLAVLGSSLILGFVTPELYKDPEVAASMRTGNAELDQLFKIVLSSSMFISGIAGCVLDNTVPGTAKERGLFLWWKNLHADPDEVNPNYSEDVYKFPYITKFLQRVKCCSYIPVSPTFDKEITCSCCYSDRKESKYTRGGYKVVVHQNTKEL